MTSLIRGPTSVGSPRWSTRFPTTRRRSSAAPWPSAPPQPGSAEAGVAVLDVCCSYGINAALLTHELTLAELFEHYTSPVARRLTRADLIEWDKEFYAARRRPGAPRVIGLDVAGNALGYARAVGLLDAACAENLEQHPASPALRRAMTEVGLITMTGAAVHHPPHLRRAA